MVAIVNYIKDLLKLKSIDLRFKEVEGNPNYLVFSDGTVHHRKNGKVKVYNISGKDYVRFRLNGRCRTMRLSKLVEDTLG